MMCDRQPGCDEFSFGPTLGCRYARDASGCCVNVPGVSEREKLAFCTANEGNNVNRLDEVLYSKGAPAKGARRAAVGVCASFTHGARAQIRVPGLDLLLWWHRYRLDQLPGVLWRC